MSWMLERIRARRTGLAEQVEVLRERLAQLEAESAELDAAERVVVRLLAEPGVNGGEGGLAVGPGSPIGQVAVPFAREVAGPGDLPEEYGRLWRLVACAPGALSCREVCLELELGTEPRHVEGMRSRLKRLVERGWLIEPKAGRFTAPPGGGTGP